MLEADALYGGTAHLFEHWNRDAEWPDRMGSVEEETDAFALDRAFRSIHGDPNEHEPEDLRTWAIAVMNLHDQHVKDEYNG